jgi:hypothetical protein
MPPIFIPVTFEPLPILASVDGSTSIVAAGEVSKSFAANLRGSTQITATLSAVLRGAADLYGSTAIVATGRLNSEANVFGAVNLQGSTQLQAAASLNVGGGAVNVTGSTTIRATARVDAAAEVSFAFVVSVHKPAATLALAKNARRFAVRLLVNGSPVPIKSATENAPADALGTELSVELARPVASQIPLDATIDFELGVWTGAGFAFEKLLTGGKLAGRSKRVVNTNNLPTDTVAVVFVDVIGDRWNLAPQANTFLYDPDTVDAPAPTGAGFAFAAVGIRDESGVEISTVSTAAPGLNLLEVLRLAYVEGCGFSAVKTNIENFPVEQVAFTLSGGYDAGVRPLLTPFAPVVFPVGNVLWILNADAPVPAGLSLRTLTVERLVEITSTLPNREPVDGILVTVKSDRIPGEFFTERLEVETTDSGNFGESGFATTTVERRVREFRSFDAPTVIRREEIASTKTTVEDGEFNVISRETLNGQFDGLNRKVGHRRSVEAKVPDPEDDGRLSVKEVSRETQDIAYGPHPLNPKADTILRVETRTEGLILVDSDNTYLDKPFKSPLIEAHRSGNVTKDGGQTVEFGALKTITEFLRVNGGAVEIETRVINHLSNAPDSSRVTLRPGGGALGSQIPRTSQATRTILLTLPGVTRRRRVAEFDGTGLPAEVALALARRQLRKLASPPLDFAGALAYPDRRIRKGDLLDIQERAGASLGRYIVTAYKREFRLSGDALEISGSVVARQLTTL